MMVSRYPLYRDKDYVYILLDIFIVCLQITPIRQI